MDSLVLLVTRIMQRPDLRRPCARPSPGNLNPTKMGRGEANMCGKNRRFRKVVRTGRKSA